MSTTAEAPNAADEADTPVAAVPKKRAKLWLVVRIVAVLVFGLICYAASSMVMANHRGVGKPAAPAADIAARLLTPGVYEHDIIPGPVQQPTKAVANRCQQRFGAQAVGVAGDVQSKALVHESVVRFADAKAAMSYVIGVVDCSRAAGSSTTPLALGPIPGAAGQVVNTLSLAPGDTTPDVDAHLRVGNYVLDVTLSARTGSPSADEATQILTRLVKTAAAAK